LPGTRYNNLQSLHFNLQPQIPKLKGLVGSLVTVSRRYEAQKAGSIF